MKRVIVKGLDKKGRPVNRVLRAVTSDDHKAIGRELRKLAEPQLLDFDSLRPIRFAL